MTASLALKPILAERSSKTDELMKASKLIRRQLPFKLNATGIVLNLLTVTDTRVREFKKI